MATIKDTLKSVKKSCNKVSFSIFQSSLINTTLTFHLLFYGSISLFFCTHFNLKIRIKITLKPYLTQGTNWKIEERVPHFLRIQV